MSLTDLGLQRMYNQRLTHHKFGTAAEMVRPMGAVQGQDYAMALWGIGQRVAGATQATIEAAIADRSIVRVSFMRGTLHFVSGPDLRWMIGLIGPQMLRLEANISRANKLGMSEEIYISSNRIIEAALRGGKTMTRPELSFLLAAEGIPQEGLRRTMTAHRAMADGLICYATRQGKQYTWALVDEWLPPAPTMEREAALVEFARRYFSSHGPATLQDYVWWSGLKVSDARAGLDAIHDELVEETVEGKTYFRPPGEMPTPERSPVVRLIPNYDEYTVAYKDRSAALVRLHERGVRVDTGRNDSIFNPAILIDGQVVGLWGRTFKKNTVQVKLLRFIPLSDTEEEALAEQVRRYGEFLGLRVEVAEGAEFKIIGSPGRGEE